MNDSSSTYQGAKREINDRVATAKVVLQDALNLALAQYEETMGEPCPISPRLKTVEDDTFWALAERVDDEAVITVSAGTVGVVDALWERAFSEDQFASGLGGELATSVQEMTMLGLIWLMLHELHHFEMGHFKLLGRSYLAETAGAIRFGAVEQAIQEPNPKLDQLPVDDRSNVEPCLELQADHDAIEMHLDAYSRDNWADLRARATAISAMVILIEREDAKRGYVNQSHPKAATRIFQLLGHVWNLPNVPAWVKAQIEERDVDPSDLPSDDEQTAYVSAVAAPVLLDAIKLAGTADAASILDDIGDQTAFSRDLRRVQTGKSSKSLSTAGAQQYASLAELNARLLALQGLEGMP